MLICLSAPAALAESRTLSLTGLGQASAPPNMAQVTVGVTTVADTAAEALASNSTEMNAVFRTLRDNGVDPADMQTSGLSLNPRWNSYGSSGKQPKIEGFEGSNSLRVTVRVIDDLGTVLDEITRAGANNIQSVSFSLKDPSPLLEQARKAAVKDAMAKADLYAEAAGVSLGPIVRIDESGQSGPAPGHARMEAMAASAVPIAAGETQIAASITIVWEIK